MTPTLVETPHTMRSIQQMLGISRRVISGLIDAGFVAPSRGPRNEYRFSFQDVVLLRTAYELQAAKIPSRKIVRSLQRLKASLPGQLPLTGLRITAIGNDIAVHEGDTRWEPESGQLLMDFELAPAEGSVVMMTRTGRQAQASADDWFAQGQRLEHSDPAKAEAAYQQALRLSPDHADAYLNLGAMLCELGRSDEAIALYGAAVENCPGVPLLHFNRAVAYEDTGDSKSALASYEACLDLDPDIADAHFNAARLHEQLGHVQLALRHFNAYRRLER